MLLAIVGVLLAVYNGLHLAIFMLLGAAIFTDYVGLWSFRWFALFYLPADMNHEAALRLVQRAEVPGFDNFLPYPHPPFFLLIMAPFQALPIDVARMFWPGMDGVAEAANADGADYLAGLRGIPLARLGGAGGDVSAHGGTGLAVRPLRRGGGQRFGADRGDVSLHAPWLCL